MMMTFPTPSPRFTGSLIEHRSVGFALMACDGHIVSVTRSFAEMLGYHVRPLVGQNIFNILTSADSGKARGLLAEGTSIPVLTRDGKSLCWIVHKIARGATLAGYYVGLLCDETQREELERQLMHQDRLAMLGCLTAAMAHEIAGPLNLIANNAELLLGEEGIHRETRESLMLMRDEAHRLADLLRDVMSYAGDAPLRITSLDIVKLVERSVRLLNHQQPCRNISLKVEAEADLPEVAGDGQRLQQVFFNLLKNACDASPDGSQVHVQVRRVELKNGGTAIEVVIKDHGEGFSPSDAERLFQPFVSSKPLGEGTGLGLPIAHRIVAAHHGELQLNSTPGIGTEAIVRLPAFSPDLGRFEHTTQLAACD
jgi:PAS domain S-box-containing protein